MIETSDGHRLDGAWSRPSGEARGVAVLCHPHPLQGGTMNAPLIRSIAGRIVDAGFHVLRFDFRGVGASEGAWGGGEGEVLDVEAAVDVARTAHPDLPMGMAGWSFGAVTALRWQAVARDTSPFAGIAPAAAEDLAMALPDPADLLPAPRLIIMGDRDQFADVADIADYTAAISARLEVIEGSDHFFVFRDMEVGRLVAEHLLEHGPQGVTGEEGAGLRPPPVTGDRQRGGRIRSWGA